MVGPNLSSISSTVPGAQRLNEATPSSLFPSSPDEDAVAACADSAVPEHRLDLDLSFAASALPSTDVSLPTPPIAKTTHNLRLPSFNVLGIAAPHPDRIQLQRSAPSFSSLGAGPLSKPDDPLHADSPPLSRPHQFGGVGEPAASSPVASRSQIEHLIPTVTPPNEPGTFNWGSFVNVKTAGVGSPPSSDPGVSPSLIIAARTSSPLPTEGAQVPTAADLDSAIGMAAWVAEVKDTITSDVDLMNLDSVKFLSHALPCPSLTGHLFGQIVAAIHEKTATPTAWINVFHAVPGRFTLQDLPKSPPSTPGPVVGGDEYFTSKVFDSAVAVPDYQLDSKLLPPSPRPVVAPGSVNVSVVERYIPPSNVNEFTEMFSIRGRSLLHDRLVELSSNHGQLLFVYPTKTGARTFMRDYLGPILDPLLRSITVVHDLSHDLGKSLGQMSSVDRLAEFEHLQAAIEKLCENLGDSSGNLQGETESKPRYMVIHASKEEVVLDRHVWANDWWIKQEKVRVRDTVTRYFRKTKKLPTGAADGEMTPTNLIQEVLDGVANRECDALETIKGVEVGVFIIKKTL
ncbi:hypothetical protein BDV96DRAFT_346700 [Lophiotrema nucula]|uniref:Uncharacterized protein n=1 Tax=Lophiotrema nucula TaxID=690887 RepID=A0A6A5ZIP9_9PLEO|nr:hypothetical protein BDV96DRAFT_346700 [Lophiotrema nucula]